MEFGKKQPREIEAYPTIRFKKQRGHMRKGGEVGKKEKIQTASVDYQNPHPNRGGGGWGGQKTYG